MSGNPTSRRRRTPRHAQTEWEQDGWLRFHWLRMYAADEEFVRVLNTFHHDYNDMLSELTSRFGILRHQEAIDLKEEPGRWMVPSESSVSLDHRRTRDSQVDQLREKLRLYLVAIDDAAEAYALQRLPGGCDVVHDFCVNRARMPSAMAESFPIGAYSFGGWRPEVGEVVTRDVSNVLDPQGNQIELIDERRQPTIHIALEGSWDARSEKRADARSRLLNLLEIQLDIQLDRIAQAFDEAGYSFEDTKSALSKHLRWLYQCIVYGDSISDIASAESRQAGKHVNPKTIDNAIRLLRKRLQIADPPRGCYALPPISSWTKRANMSVENATRCSPATVSGNRSSSLARRRKRLNQANERSTTQRRGNSTKPCRAAGNLTTSSRLPQPSAAWAASSPV
jgi:hypothetical protein